MSCKKKFTVHGFLFSPQTSSDYETMMPGVGTEPEPCCSSTAPDCTALPPPPDLCSHFTSKQRESAVTLGIGEYVDVDVPGHICQYQHLDLSRLEEHVYHSLQGNSGPKDGPLGVKEQINCWYDCIYFSLFTTLVSFLMFWPSFLSVIRIRTCWDSLATKVLESEWRPKLQQWEASINKPENV